MWRKREEEIRNKLRGLQSNKQKIKFSETNAKMRLKGQLWYKLARRKKRINKII